MSPRIEFRNAGFRDFNHTAYVLTLNPTLAEMETDEQESLLARARRGDADAFCELCRLHESRLLRQAVTLCGNISLAEEMAEDTLVEAWKCLHRHHGGCRFFTWLCAILVNRYRNTLRERRPMPFSSFPAETGDELQNRIGEAADHEPLPDEVAQHRERAALMHQCIRSLPSKHRQVIYLRFYVDDSLEGIAAALGCSVGTVKSRLFHALEKLRRMNALSHEPETIRKVTNL